jgi:hypothetical protein
MALLVEASCGTFYRCIPAAPGTDHAWLGYTVKKGTGPDRGTWVRKAGSREILVRKAAATVHGEIA